MRSDARDRGVRLAPAVAAIAVVVCVAVGAAGTYVYLRLHTQATMPPPSAATPASSAEKTMPAMVGDGALPDVALTLTPSAMQRAGIVVSTVTRGSGAAVLRLPGVVEVNAYHQVAVTPLVAGRITSVNVALGDHVSRGQPLAQIFSPELSEAQTRYVTVNADLEAAHQRLARTERLVAIGAASTQELEAVRAEHVSHATHVEETRARLRLLGLRDEQIEQLRTATDVTAAVTVTAPLDGVVTERVANVGLNVDGSTTLFRVVDLATVWVMADLYERDFASVTVGSRVAVTIAAYPGLALSGTVSYVDPQMSTETRTAKVRVEVPNRSGQLRLGMYADVSISGARGADVLSVPRSAVQTVGSSQVVYIADAQHAGTFVEREVRLGEVSGADVQVTSGVALSDRVVSTGSFSLRAERERLGLRSAGVASQPASAGAVDSAMTTETHALASDTNLQQATVRVGSAAFDPPTVTLRAGAPARLTFVRTSDTTCATEVVFPSLNIRKALPLNIPVSIDFTPEKTGEIAFVCGMNMLKGRVVVTAR